MGVSHHFLDGESFPGPTPAPQLRAPQAGVARQLEQTVGEAGQITGAKQKTGLTVQADFTGAVAIPGDDRPGGGQGLRQGAGQAFPPGKVDQDIHEAHQAGHLRRGNQAGEDKMPGQPRRAGPVLPTGNATGRRPPTGT